MGPVHPVLADILVGQNTFYIVLKPPVSQGNYQGIAVSIGGQRLDRRGLVNHPQIVQQQQRPRLAQREALAIGAGCLKHTRLAPLDTLATDQKHRHQIHSIAVRALGGGAANAVGGVNAELMCLHKPGLRTPELRAQPAQGQQQIRPRGPRRRFGQHGFKPALHAAMQCVVLQRLPMCAVHNRLQLPIADDIAGVAAAAVATTVFQVLVRRQVVPTRHEGHQVRQGGVGQCRYGLCRKHGITLPLQRVDGIGQCHAGWRKDGCRHAPKLKRRPGPLRMRAGGKGLSHWQRPPRRARATMRLPRKPLAACPTL